MYESKNCDEIFLDVFVLGTYKSYGNHVGTCLGCKLPLEFSSHVTYDNYIMCQKCIIEYELIYGPRYFINFPKYEGCDEDPDAHHYVLMNNYIFLQIGHL